MQKEKSEHCLVLYGHGGGHIYEAEIASSVRLSMQSPIAAVGDGLSLEAGVGRDDGKRKHGNAASYGPSGYGYDI